MTDVLCVYAPVPGRRVLYGAGGGCGQAVPAASVTRAYPPEAIAAVWRCGDKSTAAKVEYAIKRHLTHQQKERLAAAPELLAALLPDTAAWGVEADSCTLHP